MKTDMIKINIIEKLIFYYKMLNFLTNSNSFSLSKITFNLKKSIKQPMESKDTLFVRLLDFIAWWG